MLLTYAPVVHSSLLVFIHLLMFPFNKYLLRTTFMFGTEGSLVDDGTYDVFPASIQSGLRISLK